VDQTSAILGANMSCDGSACAGIAVTVAVNLGEISATPRELPAESMNCGSVGQLTMSDHEYPHGLTRTGMHRARLPSVRLKLGLRHEPMMAHFCRQGSLR
jgi:hypothetical protein